MKLLPAAPLSPPSPEPPAPATPLPAPPPAKPVRSSASSSAIGGLTSPVTSSTAALFVGALSGINNFCTGGGWMKEGSTTGPTGSGSNCAYQLTAADTRRIWRDRLAHPHLHCQYRTELHHYRQQYQQSASGRLSPWCSAILRSELCPPALALRGRPGSRRHTGIRARFRHL